MPAAWRNIRQIYRQVQRNTLYQSQRIEQHLGVFCKPTEAKTPPKVWNFEEKFKNHTLRIDCISQGTRVHVEDITVCFFGQGSQVISWYKITKLSVHMFCHRQMTHENTPMTLVVTIDRRLKKSSNNSHSYSYHTIYLTPAKSAAMLYVRVCSPTPAKNILEVPKHNFKKK